MPFDCPHRLRRHAGFGVLELLTSLAFLVIVMGVMVSLARYVRATSAERITQQVLRQLDIAMAAYTVTPLELPSDVQMPKSHASEADWATYAERSGLVVRQLMNVDETVSDAWGRPIGYLPFERSEIGMAPHDRPFCVSPGPDGRYLTQDDNLYSYEQSPPGMTAGFGPSTRSTASSAIKDTVAGGHRE